MSFTALLEEFRAVLEGRKEALRNLAQTNPQQAYSELNRIAYSVGSRYGATLLLHFPDPKKIAQVEAYGTENLGIVIDPKRKRFPIPRDAIKEKAVEAFGNVQTKDAYMYEGKEGMKIFFGDGSRIDILPGTLQLWCRVDDGVRLFVDWLLQECYQIRAG